MKIRFLVFVSLVFVLGGCSAKSSFFKENALEQSAVINTKKDQLYSSLEIQATIEATYLNNVLSKYKKSDQELFLVNIFIDNDSSIEDKHGIYNENYLLTLNGIKATTIEKLKFDNDLIKLTPTRNRWSTYYLLGFNKQSSEKLKLVFKHDAYGEVVLEYQKEF